MMTSSIIFGRLFWKIFLWFWLATCLLIVGTSVLLSQLQPSYQIFEPAEGPLLDMLNNHGARISRFLAKQSRAPFQRRPRFTQNLRSKGIHHFLIDEQGQEVFGFKLTPAVNQFLQGIKARPTEQPLMMVQRNHIVLGPLAIKHQEQTLQLIMLRPRHHQRSVLASLKRLPLTGFVIILTLSGLVCFWLAQHISRPINVLKTAVQGLARGELDTRMGLTALSRKDEIGELSSEFDYMAKQLQQLMMAQQRLFSDVSHELRSPLARIQVALALAQRKTSGAAEAELQRIELESERLNTLIGQMLSLTQLESRVTQIQRVEVDLQQVLTDVVANVNYESQAQAKQVVLQCKSQPLMMIMGDEGLLASAFENILRNAIYYTQLHSQVDVSLLIEPKTKPDQVIILIQDRGPGVAQESLRKIFHAFYRISQSRDRNSGGAGLGLAIAARAIACHGGNISAHNRTEGGLAIKVQLPIFSTLLYRDPDENTV